ncbi:endonuclease/exonuclease/phosphatase family metal-dependent hydrolase [Algoriphagus ratkowskyi]|uniref:Endonuclease n=1 Tax=Algoriphagus ratkowskyi TaxID=57028 RepID=A0A2W7QU63_9BACT|nr:endonuclease/exonuclease/phosphatase family protein [Algoriphagus ratkowskyi]PZX52123.1 endonuclease/exonuclease/phosphatase family metal-dependent hydrolase [Algoriphagus ratkowskyi]TXD76114.1 endonuclease [Algoriphagus ratkowskyi]
MKHNFLRVLLITIFLAISSCTSTSDKTETQVNQLSSAIVTVHKELITRNVEYDDSMSEELTIATWNIQDLGRTKDAEEITKIAQIIRHIDLVAIQEVVAKDPAGAQAVAKIVDELNRMGAQWDYRISDPTNSPSPYISERYAFLWKTSKVKLLTSAYLDSELEEVCDREPFIGKFQLTKGKEPFYVINFHSRRFNQQPEEEIIHFKNYPERLKTDRVFIVGDFNIDENHQVWDNLYRLGYNSALKGTATTLKTKCVEHNYLNHSIDNIYYSTNSAQLAQSGALDFVGTCENLEAARGISDHLPVFGRFKFK